jgi:hypothetical protein
MGFLDRLLGREEPEYPQRQSTGARPASGRSEDEIAVERYRYLLRTAPPETIEQVHTEAFSKLTSEQRDLLFQQLTADTDPSERPRDASPANLAQAATRQELRKPGTMERTMSAAGQRGGMGFGGTFASSLLGTVTGFVIGSAIASAFMPDMTSDQAGDAGGSGDAGGADAGADGAGADAGGDFGGGDFGGGDFGGGDFGF